MTDSRIKTNYSAVVFMADISWLEYAKQLISSVHFNAGWQGDYVMLAVDIPEYDLEWFRDRGVYVFKCSELSKLLNIPKSQIKTTLYRIWMFTKSFARWEYLVFLDVDMIVRADISYLLNHKSVMAAYDSNRNSLSWQLRGEQSVLNSSLSTQYYQLDELYDLSSPAFNAGVMSVHCTRIGKVVFEDLCEMYTRYAEIFSEHMNDQALMNFYFYQDWKKLPPQFNVFVNFADINYYSKVENIEAHILHFAGTQQNHKPWHPENPYYQEWLRNYNMREEFDVENKREPIKVKAYQDIQNYGIELEDEWRKLREYEKKLHSLLWWLKNPSHWFSRVFN